MQSRSKKQNTMNHMAFQQQVLEIRLIGGGKIVKIWNNSQSSYQLVHFHRFTD